MYPSGIQTSFHLNKFNDGVTMPVKGKLIIFALRLQGQFGQAEYAMKLYNNSKRNGFFVEAGAYDGMSVSNSLLMEHKYGWTGEARQDSKSAMNS